MFAFFSFSYILVIMAKEKCTAKRKYEDEHRAFLTEWESLYFFVERNSKPFCLVCQELLAHFKASNLQRHFTSLHANISHKFPKRTELRKHKLIALSSQAEKQIQIFQKFTKHSETVMLAPYLVAWNIAMAKKPYNEGEFVKKYLCDIVEILSSENNKLKRMLSDVQLSFHTVERKISDISMVIESQLHSDFQACEYFSVAFDESCDIQDNCKFLSLSCSCVTFTINPAEQRYVLMSVSKRWGDVHAIIISCV